MRRCTGCGRQKPEGEFWVGQHYCKVCQNEIRRLREASPAEWAAGKAARRLWKDAARFWSRVDRRGDSECWEWQGHRDRRGYGRLGIRGRSQFAHRVAHEFAIGPIPVGVLACHHCDNPPCVNPGHLFLGDHLANMADMRAKGRSAHGEAHHHAKLTLAAVADIRQRAGPRGTQAALAREYGVVPSHVSDIVRGKRRVMG